VYQHFWLSPLEEEVRGTRVTAKAMPSHQLRSAI